MNALLVGAISGMTAVALSAFGAHARFIHHWLVDIGLFCRQRLFPRLRGC